MARLYSGHVIMPAEVGAPSLVRLRRTRMARLRVGGVPEHFFYPWRRVVRSGQLKEALGLEVEFEEFHGGSGAMASALKEGRLDAACMLTEAAVAQVCKGAGFKVLGAYTASPLTWGVHARADWTPGPSPARFAVSRMGSGSHLMALVDAQQRGVPAPTEFVCVESMEGARAALADGRAELFMWEKFTTKPHVDSGEWKRVAEVPTPWPAFSVAVADGADLDAVVRAVELVKADADALVASPTKVGDFAHEYGLLETDVENWLATVAWAVQPRMPRATVDLVQTTLASAGIITPDQIRPYDDIVLPGRTQDLPVS